MEYGLIGEHLPHSFSPEIHKRIGNYKYEIKELEPEAEVTEGLAVRGGSVAEEEDNIRQWVKDK